MKDQILIYGEGPEGETLNKRKETDPIEVASYDKPWWLIEVLNFIPPGVPMGSFRWRERKKNG